MFASWSSLLRDPTVKIHCHAEPDESAVTHLHPELSGHGFIFDLTTFLVNDAWQTYPKLMELISPVKETESFPPGIPHNPFTAITCIVTKIGSYGGLSELSCDEHTDGGPGKDLRHGINVAAHFVLDELGTVEEYVMTTEEGDQRHSAEGLPAGEMQARFPGMEPGEWHDFKPWGGATYTNTEGWRHRVRAHYLPDSGSCVWTKATINGTEPVRRIRLSFIFRTNSKTNSACWLRGQGAMLANKVYKEMIYKDKVIDSNKTSTKDTLASDMQKQEQLVRVWEV